MDRTNCVISWPAALMPDVDCVPGDEVFLDSAHSPTAKSIATPDPLLTAPTLPDVLLQYTGPEHKKKKSRQKKKRSRA